VKVPKLYERLLGSKFADNGACEGTCEPHGSALWVFPHLVGDYSTNCGRISRKQG
jgi:hypothetical protein